MEIKIKVTDEVQYAVLVSTAHRDNTLNNICLMRFQKGKDSEVYDIYQNWDPHPGTFGPGFKKSNRVLFVSSSLQEAIIFAVENCDAGGLSPDKALARFLELI